MRDDIKSNIVQRYITQKKTLYWLLSISYITFFSFYLMNAQEITNFNYSFHEMLGIPVTIGFYLIPIIMIIYLFQLIKYIKAIGIVGLKLKTILKICIALLSVIFIINSLYNWQYRTTSVSGFIKVEQKLQNENKFFLVLNGERLEVSKSDYDLVIQSEYYMLSYTYNERTKKGQLNTVELEKNMELEDSIDNEDY